MRLEIFLAHFQKAEWIVRIEYRGRHRDRVLVARPIFGAGFGEDFLWSKGRRILAASATILDKGVWCASVGLDPADVEFVQIASDFPKENRPIYREYVGSMARAEKDATIPKLVAWIRDTLLPRYPDKRGIIHTHSFHVAQSIVGGVGSDRLLLHAEGQDKNEILRQHAARADSVIVAPAFHEGIDLKDDLARFAVIAKIPYPNLGDEVVAARKAMDDGNLWYSWQTSLKLVQSYGRPVRSKDDYADTYVTDDGFERFLQRSWAILPGWFKEALTVRRP
jgi:Rad3-related DNA helicase